MLYASTKATLTKELGDSKFVDTVYGTSPPEMTFESYQQHLVHKSAEAPLTEREQELQTVKLAESGADIAISSRRAHAQGVNFPISPAATAALQKLKDASDLTVILTIDTAKERIELDKAEATSIQSLKTVVPADVPRFVFLPYLHTFEGESCRPIIFAYICPPQSKVKERMLFSSSRATLLSFVEEQLQIPVARKLELDSVDELDEADLLDSLHPKRAEVLSAKPAFSRPRGPGGRGTPRTSRPGTPASTGSA
ncbi:Toll-like receptor 9 [Rhizophlyctis rosea]|nr:Toll-like receptor 9 [Rhizophlyctis rosea]